MNYTSILTIKFSNHISKSEIPLLRGAIINALEHNNILFHNHNDDNSLRYSYPLIQYKRIGGCAAIVCIGEGTEAIYEYFHNFKPGIILGARPISLEVQNVRPHRALIQIWNDTIPYKITSWLPFNQENYQVYQKMESMNERLAFLERIMTGNILSFAKGIDIHFDQQITCSISEILRTDIIEYKNVKMTSFNLLFKSNVSLPDNIGLGKGVSLGNGTIHMIKTKNTQNTTE